MSDDCIRVASHRRQVLVAVAQIGHQYVAEDELRASAPVKHLAHHLTINARQLGANGPEDNSFCFYFLPVDGTGGDDRLVSTALQFQRQSQVRMNVAVGTEGMNEDASHGPLIIINGKDAPARIARRLGGYSSSRLSTGTSRLPFCGRGAIAGVLGRRSCSSSRRSVRRSLRMRLPDLRCCDSFSRL